MKWVGGKRKLVTQRRDVFRPAGAGTVHVPFVGGGAPFFMVYGGTAVRLSDRNARLVNLYQATQRDPDRLADACEVIAAAYGSWRDGEGTAQRQFFELQRSWLDEGPAFERAARFYFVVRWGFNGLYRENLRGVCNTAHGDAARKRVDREHLRACGRALARAAVSCTDFEDACSEARAGDFVYLDPPFQPLSDTASFTSYSAGGTWGKGVQAQTSLPGQERKKSDRERLVDLLADLDRRCVDWTLSDACTPATRELYARWHVETVQMRRSVNRIGTRRGPAPELVVRNWGPR